MKNKIYINLKNRSIVGVTTVGEFAAQMEKVKEMTESNTFPPLK